MNDCIFCKIVRGEIPSFKVYEDERVFAFMDINPISEGHALIIPKNHAENLWEISEKNLEAIHKVSKKLVQAMQTALTVDGVAILQLNGRSVGQEVMHYHMHLMPHKSGEPKLPVTHWELRPGDMDAVKATGEKIAAALQG